MINIDQKTIDKLKAFIEKINIADIDQTTINKLKHILAELEEALEKKNNCNGLEINYDEIVHGGC